VKIGLTTYKFTIICHTHTHTKTKNKKKKQKKPWDF